MLDSIKLAMSAGISTFRDVESVAQSLHEAIEIRCFYEGRAALMIGNQFVSVEAGDVVVINPYEFHAVVDHECEEVSGKYHLFTIPLDYFCDRGVTELNLRQLIFVRKKSFQTLFCKDEEIFRILMQAASEFAGKDTAYGTLVDALMAELFVIFLRRGMEAEGSYVLRSDTFHAYQLIEPALRCIRDSYAENLTVEQLASACKMSKYYFCREFKSATEKTAMEYLREYRLQLADALLGNTDKSITQIAEQCGFKSMNYFFKCYKERYGDTPRNRRKNS